MITQEEWKNKIMELWGTPLVLLSISELSLDEHISRARILHTGTDPHLDKRKSKAQELSEILSQRGRKNWLRDGDEPYFDLLRNGLINYPPQDRLDLIDLKHSNDFLGQYQLEF